MKPTLPVRAKRTGSLGRTASRNRVACRDRRPLAGLGEVARGRHSQNKHSAVNTRLARFSLRWLRDKKILCINRRFKFKEIRSIASPAGAIPGGGPQLVSLWLRQCASVGSVRKSFLDRAPGEILFLQVYTCRNDISPVRRGARLVFR